MVKLGLGLWGETVGEVAQAARDAESAGYHSVWTSESQRSAIVPAAAAAVSTSHVQVGTSVALAFVRSALTTALLALDLDDLTSGRFILGLGTGVRRLVEDWHGSAFDGPLARMRGRVAAIRALTIAMQEGADVDLQAADGNIHMKGFYRPYVQPRNSPPIYLAGVGPGMLRLAGEVADGWLSHELASLPYYREHVLPGLEAGLANAGRRRQDIVRVGATCCVPHNDVREARRMAAGTVGFYATVRTYAPFFAFHGFEAEAAIIRRKFRESGHADAASAVTSEMIDALTITGTPDDVRTRVKEYDGVVDVLRLHAPRHLLEPDQVRDIQRRILEL